MLFLIPLGDSVERKRLILLSLLGTAVMLDMVAAAPNLHLLIASSFGSGLVNITPQLVVTYSATLAPPLERGRTVGSS